MASQAREVLQADHLEHFDPGRLWLTPRAKPWSWALERIRQLLPSHTRGGSRVRESRSTVLGGGVRTHVPAATAPRVHHILRAKARHRPTAWLCRQPSANRSRPFSEQGFFLILSRKQGACAPTSTETSNFSRLFQRLRASGAHFPVIRWIRELNDHFREAESPGAGSPFAGSGPYEPRVYRSNKGAGPSGLGVAVPRLRQQKDHTIQAGIVNT